MQSFIRDPPNELRLHSVVLTSPECLTDSLPLAAKTFPLRSCLNLPISFNQVEKSFWQHDRGGHNASLISRLSPRHNFHPSHRHEDEGSGQSAIMPVRHLRSRGGVINGSLGGKTAVQWGTHSVLRLSPCQKTF